MEICEGVDSQPSDICYIPLAWILCTLSRCCVKSGWLQNKTLDLFSVVPGFENALRLLSRLHFIQIERQVAIITCCCERDLYSSDELTVPIRLKVPNTLYKLKLYTHKIEMKT